MARGQGLHGTDLSFDAFRALAIALVDHKDVSDFHDAGLDRLDIVPHAGHEHDDRDIREPYDVDFVLPNTDGLNENQVASGGIEHGRNIGCGPSQTAQRSPRCHAADVDARICMMLLHPNAIAKDRATCVGTGRVDGDDAQRFAIAAIVASQLIDEGALPRSGRTGQTHDAGPATKGKQRLQQLARLGRSVFNRTDRSRQRASIPGSQLLHPALKVVFQTFKCKADGKHLGT
jgi:hypothetical protein